MVWSDLMTASGADSGLRVTAEDGSVFGAGRTLDDGTELGRFEIRRLLGSGGIGNVYAAFDPELAREVAIKILHRDETTDRSGPPQERSLVREARMMASLSHPNVARVLLVGELGGYTAIVMELLPGGTLGAWLKATRRSWLEIVDMFLQAGQGLVAAHETGLVHRDFKPENVLLGADGRPRVTDFGLARTADEAPTSSPTNDGRPGPTLLSGESSIRGTPAYMSPEQHLGLAVGPAADQFSFAVTLYEALYRIRPFHGRGLTELALAVTAGQVRPPPEDSDVPPRIERAVLRALSTEPAERWPSVAELLDALRHNPSRRPWFVGGLAIAGVAAAFVPLWPASDGCEDAAARVQTLWASEKRSAVAKAFVASSDSSSANPVIERLDRWSAEWFERYPEACEGGRDEETRSADARLLCLRAQYRQVEAMLPLLVDADEAVVARGDRLASMVPKVTDCLDLESVRNRRPLPEDTELRERVATTREEIGRARVLLTAGDLDEAAALSSQTTEQAQDIGFDPLRAEALHLQGIVSERQGDYKSAEASLMQAEQLARAHGLDSLLIETGIELSYLVGYRQSRPEDGLRWVRATQAIVDRNDEDSDVRVRLLVNEATLHERLGDYQSAFEQFDLARQRLEQSDSPKLISVLINMGLMLNRLGRPSDAQPHLERAVELGRARWGNEHGLVATAINHLGMALEHQEDFAGANMKYREALALREASLGPEHPQVATSLNNVALMERKAGELKVAQELVSRGLEIREAAFGPDSPRTAFSANLLGAIASEQGRHDEAIALHHRALAIYEASMGPDHPEVATVLDNLGDALGHDGQSALALTHQRRALEIRRSALGTDHRETALSELQVGRLLQTQGKPHEAVDHFERARAVLEPLLPPEHPTRKRLDAGPRPEP